jgi:hypothetical protein
MPADIDFDNINFPENQYLHKEKSENIHIYNLRRSPPRVIHAETFETEILPFLNERDRMLLLNYYIKERRVYDKTMNSRIPGVYILNSVPNRISTKTIANLIDDELSDKKNRDIILSLYRKEEGRDSYLLNRKLNLSNQMDIIKILYNKNFLITDTESTGISKILEGFSCIKWDDTFIANVHIDPSHPYFFEHLLDHVPGMMLIETARQMFTACSHIYGKVPVKGISFILNDMNIHFSDYIWLSYPIRIELVMTHTTYHNEGYWYNCSCKVNLYQDFIKKATISISGTTMKSSFIDNLIMNKHAEDIKFMNSPASDCSVFLSHLSRKTCLKGTIADISHKHFVICIKEKTLLKADDEFEFKISHSKKYTANGVCRLKKYQKINNTICGFFMISQLNPVDRENINEIIKRINHTREQVGIY